MEETNYELLVADLKDGYSKIANLLLEGLTIAPINGPEFRILCLIIRRTYGYNKRADDSGKKIDHMYHADIARGTNLSQRTVEGALRNLKRANMIVIEKTADTNKTAYGINTRLHQWGNDTKEWKDFIITLRDSQAYGIFNRGRCTQNTRNTNVNSNSMSHRKADKSPQISGDNGTQIYGDVSSDSRRRLRKSTETSPQICGDTGAFSPTATGGNGASKDYLTDYLKEKDASPVGEADQTALEMGLEHTPKIAPVIRAQSPQQRVGDATLNMFRLTHDSLSKEQCAKYYKAIASVIKSTYLGAEGILEWIAKQPQQTLGEGSDPAISIPAYLRSNFQTYQKHLEFAKERQQRMGESGNCASYGDAGAGGNGNGSKKTPSRQDDILTYWKIRALEDVNDKLPTPDMDTRSRLAGERQRIVVRIGYEPDFDTKPQSA